MESVTYGGMKNEGFRAVSHTFSSPWVSGPPLIDVSFRQNGSWPVAVPSFQGRNRPEIGFVPSEWQLAGCDSRLEAGIDLKLGLFRQNGSWPVVVPASRRG